ncbi:MAG: CpsD/CapB family tyrosine-protein kinase [Methylophilus sp.]|nr:CpsD/CapB family tyrosine-protein kinase [Methylophilus sp.]MDP3607947.1 CpsD/CapB family tyrosine-protein kinase [Methylophilus sp.]
MEKIKDALEKAKGKSIAISPRKLSDAKVESASAESILEQANETNINAINYTNTKTIQLNSQHLEKSRIVSYNKSQSATWIFDKLRTQVLQKMQENNWKSMAIVSPTPGCGKSFVAINLAISIANQPQKTAMLVDFDLRKPRVAKYLGIDSDKSLSDYLENRAELHEVLINPGLPHLVILPTMRPISHPAEVLSSAKVNALIQDIATRYESRIVIYDLPPILNADDALIMLKKVDCALLVVGNGMVKESEIEEAMYHIPKEKLLGVILNKAETTAEEYYY